MPFGMEMPWYLFNDGPMRTNDSNPVGYINREFASWEDLNGTGYKFEKLNKAIRNFERKAKRYRKARQKCEAACLIAYDAAAIA